MHLALVEVYSFKPCSRQFGDGPLELITSCLDVAAAFEAPITNESRTDHFVHPTHYFDESFNLSHLANRYKFFTGLDLTVLQRWL